MIGRGRIAILHDYFAVRGGGERLVIELAEATEATLFFGYADNYHNLKSLGASPVDLSLPDLLRRQSIRTVGLRLLFAAQRQRMARFETRIFSGVYAPFAAPGPALPGRNIFYCHTPPRFLYDQRAFFTERASPLQRLGMATIGGWFQRGYEEAVGRMHLIVTNSENVRGRIQRYLGRDSIVVYPPCDTAAFSWGEPQGYYLSTARLTALKRVDRIVDAFIGMPGKQLVVASGGEELEPLKRRAAGAPNIRFTGWTSEEQMRQLIAGAIATIYVPIDEDFGMSPVESMSAGKPVIGVAEGGLLETVLEGETGTLLPPGFTVADLAGAVTTMTPARALTMRRAAEARAKQFSRERFIAGMRDAIALAHRS